MWQSPTFHRRSSRPSAPPSSSGCGRLTAPEGGHDQTKGVARSSNTGKPANQARHDRTRLNVGSGSNSNVAERGMENEVNRACILEIDAKTGQSRVYASRLRNPVGLAWEPETKMLWVAVNERDELGSDLVPDYMTSVKEGGFYGWPYSI